MSGPVCTAEFDWTGDDSIIAREQPAIAVYNNTAGAVVVRQERAWDEDSDTYILIQPENAEKIADAILRAAGFDLATEPVKDHTAAERMRRYRNRRNAHRNAPLLLDHQEGADQNAA
jgi:hypothetical protein